VGSDGSRAAGCVIMLLLCVLSMRVTASDALRVLIRVAAPGDRALVARVRGQLSDVNVELVPMDTPPLEATFAEQVQVAHALAEERGADVVLWFASTPAAAPAHASGLLVHVATPGNERILTRRLLDAAAASGGKPPSSLLETAALAVRSAVSALVAGGGIGVTTAQALAEEDVVTLPTERALASALPALPLTAAAREFSVSSSSKAPPSAAARQSVTPSASRAPPSAAARQSVTPSANKPPPPAAASELVDTGAAPEAANASRAYARAHARMQLGVQCVVDGQSQLGARGAYARAGIAWGAFSLDAYAVASLASSVDDDYFALHVARHALGGALAAHTRLTPSAELAVGVQSGAVLLARTSSAQSTGVRSAPSSLMAAFAFGPELGLDWLFGRYGVGVQLALDVLPSAPRFETTGASALGAGDSHRLSIFEPRVSIGWQAAVP
jgi:hypothetical protein